MGVSVEGFDSLVMNIPAGRIFAQEGHVRIAVTPRHSIAEMDNFGELTPEFFRMWGDATNYIVVRISAANTVQMWFDDGGGAHNAAWAAAGALVAGTEYLFEVKWDAVHMELLVDGVQRINIVQPVAFVTVPTAWWAGTTQLGTQQVDAVFGSP